MLVSGRVKHIIPNDGLIVIYHGTIRKKITKQTNPSCKAMDRGKRYSTTEARLHLPSYIHPFPVPPLVSPWILGLRIRTRKLPAHPSANSSIQRKKMAQKLEKRTTVDGWNPANQLRLVVYPIIYRVSYIPGGARFQPSTVCGQISS